jgi:toxin ParE1/3/4
MTLRNPPVRKLPAAQRDLLDHFVDLGERAGEAIALRFLQAAEDTFADLAAMPGMGRTEDFDNPRLTGMRRWRVHGFDNYLIFYQPLSPQASKSCASCTARATSPAFFRLNQTKHSSPPSATVTLPARAPLHLSLYSAIIPSSCL